MALIGTMVFRPSTPVAATPLAMVPSQLLPIMPVRPLVQVALTAVAPRRRVLGQARPVSQTKTAGPAPLWVVFLVGGAAGWISAFGGAWKDAPIEGFQTLKFFRSPAMAGSYAVLVSLLTDDLVFITMAAEGFVIMTTETYKTFFFPSKPRGKFAGKPVVFPAWLRLRQRFVPLYVLIWLAVIGAYGVAVVKGERVTVNLWERTSD